MYFDQSSCEVRFEWGEPGLAAIGLDVQTIVIVDVLSFSTCVDVATSRGAFVLPYGARDGALNAFAQSHGAIVAESTRKAEAGFSLSPMSLEKLLPGTRLVLPSPNGSALSRAARKARIAGKCASVVTASLRNAGAVAEFLSRRTGPVAVIASGERWPDGTLRPAWEDLVGAGAIISRLGGTKSPEAIAAADTFENSRECLPRRLRDCSSGRELRERGFSGDVELAAMFDVSPYVPVLINNAFAAHDSTQPTPPPEKTF